MPITKICRHWSRSRRLRDEHRRGLPRGRDRGPRLPVRAIAGYSAGTGARVTTVTTALSGELPTQLRFFGVSYRMPVGELDPVWPRTLMALRQKAPVVDGQRWRPAPDVAVGRGEVRAEARGGATVTVRGGS